MTTLVYAVEDLVIDLYTPTVSVRAVDGVSFFVNLGETLAVVGESGSGKTVMTLGPLGLLPEGVSIDLKGSARAAGRDLVKMSPRGLSRLRGGHFGVIFQDPMSALNPMLKIGPQIAEQARRFTGPFGGSCPWRGDLAFWPEPVSPIRKTDTTATRTSFPAACCSVP